MGLAGIWGRVRSYGGASPLTSTENAFPGQTKVLHVVPSVSDDGAFGGPVRVALNQVRELSKRDVSVILIGGRTGRSASVCVDGVPVRAFFASRVFPSRSWASLLSITLILWVAINRRHFDVVHLHGGRDLLTMFTALTLRVAGVPYLMQTHGMIMPSMRFATRIWDGILTRRVLKAAACVLVLTEDEQAGLKYLVRDLKTFPLANGVPFDDELVRNPRLNELDVLFLARMQARKRPDLFVKSALALTAKYPEVSWSLVGPDEGELAQVLAIARRGCLSALKYEGTVSYNAVLTRMERSEVYVLPSIDEPFPMSLLEAMSLGLACICTRSCGIAQTVREADAALVIGHSLSELIAAVERLVSEPELRSRLSTNARSLVRSTFSMEAIVDRLLVLYTESVYN